MNINFIPNHFGYLFLKPVLITGKSGLIMPSSKGKSGVGLGLIVSDCEYKDKVVVYERMRRKDLNMQGILLHCVPFNAVLSEVEFTEGSGFVEDIEVDLDYAMKL
jgi:hypothetical protein